MKILAFVDSHANEHVMAQLAERAKEADIVLCAGDISVFGTELLESLEAMNSWGKPVYLVHGNHEEGSVLADVNDQFPNLHFVHKAEHDIGEFSVLGYGGGGFAKEDPELAKYSKRLKPKRNRFLIFHGPPHGTKIDWLDEWDDYRGCKTRRKMIEDLQPVLAIAGHLHPNAGKRDRIGNTIVMNPGPVGTLITIEPKDRKEKARHKKQ